VAVTGGGSNSDGGGSEYADGGTFTMAISGDPGKLDPHSSVGTQLFAVNQLAYDNLVSVDEDSGEIQSQLATDWEVDGTTVTLTLADGVTCADGSDFTATAVADNVAYVSDPKNKSPYLGTFLPAGATAKADDAAGTVTITLAQPAPFVLNGLASLPMVCESGLADRASLAAGTAGTGPYELTAAVPGRPVHLSDPRRLHVGTERCHLGGGGHAGHRGHEGDPERGDCGQPADLG
jgi:peptide/nickel transport system substrate-binding protein